MYKHVTLRIVVSVLISLAVCILTYKFLQGLREDVSIVVAKETIEKGVKLEENQLETIKVDKKNLDLYPYVVSNKADIVGSITRKEIEKNKPIEKKPSVLVFDNEKTKALNYKGKVDNSYFITEGMRIIGIEVDAGGSLNHSLKRGDYVDVIYSSKDDSKGGLYSNMILQHVEIFDIEESKVDKGETITRKQRVMLLATPEDCLKIAVGNRNGILDLALNPLSGKTKPLDPVNILSFLAKPSEKLKELEEIIKKQDISQEAKEKLLNDLKSNILKN